MTSAAAATGTIACLEREWSADLANRHHRYGSLGDWTGSALIAYIRSLPRPERDGLGSTLIALAQAGDRDAERVLVKMMMPKAFSLGRQRSRTQHIPLSEALDAAISAIWEAVRTYPVARLPRSVFGNIGFRALNLLAKDFGKPEDTVEFNEAFASAISPNERTPEEEVAELLNWALDSRSLSRKQVRILSVWHFGTKQDRASYSGELGVRVETLKRYANTATHQLRAAVQTHIAQNGHW